MIISIRYAFWRRLDWFYLGLFCRESGTIWYFTEREEALGSFFFIVFDAQIFERSYTFEMFFSVAVYSGKLDLFISSVDHKSVSGIDSNVCDLDGCRIGIFEEEQVSDFSLV